MTLQESLYPSHRESFFLHLKNVSKVHHICELTVSHGNEFPELTVLCYQENTCYHEES